MAARLNPPRPDSPAWFQIEDRDGVGRLILGGLWVLSEAGGLDRGLAALSLPKAGHLDIDCGGLARLDTTGAWLVLRTQRRLEHQGMTVALTGMPAAFQPLVDAVNHECRAPPVTLPGHPTFAQLLERIGRATIGALEQAHALLEFFGRVVYEASASLLHPRRLRIAALFHQMEETGLNALPIIGLLSFLVGVVFAFQGSDQLRRFGAEIFTVNLLGVSILRELGGLMTAILVAGRSGSAFTAQIGTMKVNEEIDALETLGLNTIEVLVLPRILALVITLPLLTFYADVMGMLGGAIMSYFDLGITLPAFTRQLRDAITGWTLWVGLIKAPIFAFIIALVGCFEGLQVERNAASVGKLTTQSVVEGIFIVIIADAGFSILFSMLGI